jgi:uncharacterized lipoprotein YddW (UPF0748 family)
LLYSEQSLSFELVRIRLRKEFWVKRLENIVLKYCAVKNPALKNNALQTIPLKRLLWLSLASLVFVSGFGGSSALAQLSMQVTVPDGKTLDITGRNTVRGDDALILYDKAFGQNTKTNPYGVEVIALPENASPTDGKAQGARYRITQVTRVWDCAENKALICGNAEIPQDGIVLSAMGKRRDLLKSLKVGDTMVLQEAWVQQKQMRVDVVDPTPQNNPAGSGFPGYRASNQIIVYDSDYGRPNTGTNEFGFEVTVRNGIVTAQEGSDSAIPVDGFVLSGHGRGRDWLINNAPPGAKIQLDPDGKSLTSTIDFDTYTYQFEQRWAQSPCASSAWSAHPAPDSLCNTIRTKKEEAVRLSLSGQTDQAASTMADALESLNRRTWLSYSAFPATTIRGAWHRPVEKTPIAIGKTLDTLKSAGINTVFLETFFHGYTIFPSRTFEAYGLPAENPKFQGQDLLKMWVDEAHKRGMKVHTWFQTFYGGTKAYLPPGPILSKYPAWANVQYAALVPMKLPVVTATQNVYSAAGNSTPLARPLAAPTPSTAVAVPKSVSSVLKNVAVAKNAGLASKNAPAEVILKTPAKPVPSNLELGAYFLDPANPQVQEFLVKLAEEIVTRYDIDGFQLDYIRYPASFPADRFSFRKTTWGYTDMARTAFKAKYGMDPAEIDPKDPAMANLWMAWSDFKTQQVNHFVEKITKDIRARNPKIQISAAVFPDADAALALKQQDWKLWGRNGWIDFYAPMTLTSAIKVVDHDTRDMLQATGNKVPVFSGIFGPFNDNSAEHILSQIDTAKQAGASGYVLFDTAHLTARTLEALKAVQMPRQATTTSPVPMPGPESQTSAPVAMPKKHHWWSRK